jgi:hypothetical protein
MPGDVATSALFDEVLESPEELCSHIYGSYVMRHLLEFGSPEQRHLIVVALLPRAYWHAKHKLGSHVVEAALRTCSEEDQLALVQALLNENQLVSIATNGFGRHVLRAMLAMTTKTKQMTAEALWKIEPQLKSTRTAKDVLQALRAVL